MYKLVDEETFEGINFTSGHLEKGDYEYCKFINCDFANADLSGISFLECSFISCNLSMANLEQTALKDIFFKDCKIMGVHFDSCNKFNFAVHFEKCILDHSSFYQVKMKKTKFKECRMKETDFTETDLTDSQFDECNLEGTIFFYTILEKADFSTAYNYILDPETNRIKKAKFSLSGLPGLLAKYQLNINSI